MAGNTEVVCSNTKSRVGCATIWLLMQVHREQPFCIQREIYKQVRRRL